jgi:hypothetical protein
MILLSRLRGKRGRVNLADEREKCEGDSQRKPGRVARSGRPNRRPVRATSTAVRDVRDGVAGRGGDEERGKKRWGELEMAGRESDTTREGLRQPPKALLACEKDEGES